MLWLESEGNADESWRVHRSSRQEREKEGDNKEVHICEGQEQGGERVGGVGAKQIRVLTLKFIIFIFIHYSIYYYTYNLNI